MIKLLRIAAGLALTAGLLHLASLAVHDCTTGLGAYENCVWVWVREHSGLPPSKLLRSLTLEAVGLALLAGLYVTVRYVFPWKERAGRTQEGEAPDPVEDPAMPERRALQVLSQGTPEGSIRERAREILRDYRWRDPLHEAIYQALLSLPDELPDTIRLELPSRLTRRGFPDFDLEMLFTPHGLSKSDAEQLIERLRAFPG